MLTSTGDISSLMEWFYKSEFKYMSLLVAGHLNDYELFKDVFENRVTINNVTGNKIAVFLFCDGKDDVLSFALDEKIRRRKYRCLLPGELINGMDDDRTYSSIDDVSNLTPDIREQVIQKSKLISEDIRVYFNIPVDKIPCILLIEKGQKRENTYVIPTKGELDIQKFYKFLKDLAHLLEGMPEIKSIETDLNKLDVLRSSYETLEYTTKNLEKIDNKILDLTTELDIQIKVSREILIELGLPKQIAKQLVTREEWKNIKSSFINKNFGELTKEIDLDIIQKALYNKTFRESIGNIQLAGKRYDKIKRERTGWNTRLNRTNDRIRSLSDISPEETNAKIKEAIVGMESLKKEIEKLEKKYSRLFWRASKIRPLRDFMKSFLGFTKATKDVLSAEEAINKLINRE